MSGVRTPSFRLSRTITRTVPPRRRNARSWSSAHTCVLECHTSSRTALRECPSVSTKSRVRRYLPVCGGRTIGRPAAPPAHRDPGRLQIVAGRLPANASGGFDAPQRPAQSPQPYYLLLFVIIQDVAHGGVGACAPRCRQRLGPLRVVAGFQMSINGRFWVSTEASDRGVRAER